MKYILILFFIISSCQIGMAQGKDEVIWIIHSDGIGDWYRNIFIGTHRNDISKLERELDMPSRVSRYVINQQSISAIKTYIMDNCDKVDHMTDTTGNRFTIRILRKNSKTICYIKDDKTFCQLYFQNLLKLIERPLYKGNCKQLINEFNGIIESLNH